MRTVSEKYANSSQLYIDDNKFFSTETITVPIGFRLFAIVNNRKNIHLSGTGALAVPRLEYMFAPQTPSTSYFLSAITAAASALFSSSSNQYKKNKMSVNRHIQLTSYKNDGIRFLVKNSL